MILDKIDIVGGPSKFDFLQTICFRKYPRQEVTFKITSADGSTSEISCRIYTITAHDHKGKNIGEEGHEWFFLACTNDIERLVSVRGKYSTKTRKGWIEPITPDIDERIQRLLKGI